MKSIRVSIADQSLSLLEGNAIVKTYLVSTAKNGPGELNGSECTPRGRHRIRAMIGSNAPPNAVFIGRRQTGEIYSPALRENHPERDWILTRIMWLSGLEPGRNRFGEVDTMRRYIYIHGCPDDDPMGIPTSHGCIKMRNSEIVELFDLLEAGTEVLID